MTEKENENQRYRTFPNRILFDRFCSTLHTNVSGRLYFLSVGSLTIPKDSGEMMTGQKKRRKTKPPTHVYLLSGNRFTTSLCVKEGGIREEYCE